MQNSQRRIDRALVVVFAALLFVPLCVQLVRYSSENDDVLIENRVLGKLPAAPSSWKDWSEYPRKFDAFYKDQFGLRADFLSIAMTAKQYAGVSIHTISVTGRDGWVFLARQSLQERVEGLPRLTVEQLEDFSLSMQGVKEFLNSKGIVFLHFAAPEKQSIYPEYMPRSVHGSKQTPLDQVNAHLKSPSYINVKRALLGYKSGNPDRLLYYQIDTHWNCWGAYLAYREIVQRGLIEQGIAVPMVEESDIAYRDVSEFGSGRLLSPTYWLSTLMRKDARYECLLEESSALEMHLRSSGRRFSHINGEVRRPEASFKKSSALYKDWQATDRRGQSSLKALIVRDSFASRSVAYFNRSFSDVLYVHHQNMKGGKLGRLLQKFQPDVVIFEYAERYLNAPRKNLVEPLKDSLQME